MIGETVGHYKIEEKIGEGGMGVVYRAEDIKLKRTVALKFLPSDATRSAEARERFIHEAQAASALDHPNICTIYEIDETDEGQVYIAMGLYEGQTLREKIAERPLKLEDAIDITTQISKGLAKAHEQKIVHRDIKSANIFITTEGQVKILDFGLAKLHGQTKLTLTGTTLGTVSYMAPEQARGEEADHRADIWSLGIVMYEMLTGQQPFKGEHEQAVIYSILNDEAEPITALRSGIPLDLEWVIQKALRKDPRQRYQHIDEIPVDLSSIADVISTGRRKAETYPATMVSDSHPSRISIKGSTAVALSVIILACGFILASISGLFRGNLQPQLLQLNVRFNDLRKEPSESEFAISPDGQTLAFSARPTDLTMARTRGLYVRSLRDGVTHRVPDSDWAVLPFFSPDGQWLGFCNYRTLVIKKFQLEKDVTFDVCTIGDPITAAAWSSNGQIYYNVLITRTTRSGSAVYSVSENGGVPTQITVNDSLVLHSQYLLSQFLPDGNRALITRLQSGRPQSDIGLLDVQSGTLKIILEGAYTPRYTNRYLTYVRENSIVYSRFNVRRGIPVGAETISPYSLRTSGEVFGLYSISADGTLVFESPETGDDTEEGTQLVWVNRQGVVERLPFLPVSFNGVPRISPDGTMMAGCAVPNDPGATNNELYVMEIDGSNLRRITFSASTWAPVWHPDNRTLTVNSDHVDGNFDLYTISIIGSSDFQPLHSEPEFIYPLSRSRDGSILTYYKRHNVRDRDAFALTQSGEVIPISATEFDERTPIISQDGNYVVFVSNRSGRQEVYIVPFPNEAGIEPVQVTSEGGFSPQWNPQGNSVFFRSGSALYEQDISFSPYISPEGPPRMLFDGPYNVQLSQGGYVVHPDGERFLMSEEYGAGFPSTLTIVLNWMHGNR